ncbi:hypothetical protein [Vampirovibrio chlorellavorus]|uniref:hypothetical protein n=1 Tax=Vampirovibrio chlorellavorus TaxID=758823 RepID=UPI0026EE161F|nr:hypothetical protein [Vampirovibrio chlorellavorus]
MNPLPRLSESQIERIRQVKHVFEKVERLTGVPWQAVAAVWYRESFSVTPPKTPGGPFQFDPVLQPETICNLLKFFTRLSSAEIEQYASKGINDFETGALCAACWLRLKTKPVITPEASDEVIKDALYGYNGRAYGGADKSPYVMNGFDQTHRDMVLRGTIPDGRGGRKWVEIVDKRPGAFTVYKQLKSLIL